MNVASIVAGEDVRSGSRPRVLASYRGARLADVWDAGPGDVERVVEATALALDQQLEPHRRAQILRAAAARIRAAADDYAALLVDECAKPRAESLAEVRRSVAVLEECAEEATRVQGHLVPVQGVAGSEDRLAFTIRRPVGIVAAITPFNGALLSPAHKVGAAIAAGAPCVLKPADATPACAYRFVRDLLCAGLPADWVSLLVSSGPETPAALVAHPRIGMVSFTGSTAVGLQIRRELGLRPAILELGGNAPLIVHEDADVAAAAAAAVPGAFGYAGQVCVSVQRIYVHRSRYAEFRDAFLEGVAALRVGDPADPDVDVGPLLTEARAVDLERDVEAAVADGARLLTPLRREGALVWPVVVEDASPSSRVVCEEAFAPVVGLRAYDGLADAFAEANRTRYGLQVGVFTSDYAVMHRAMHALDFGGVIFNDTSRYRVDRMPYGGTKASGSGVEGVRYSIEQMTTERLVVMRPASRDA